MKKKIVSCVLVASLLFSIGCYNTGMLTKEELKAKVERVDITVCTKDSLEYRFAKENYRIQGDTLSGSGVRVIANTSAPYSVVTSIALADITSIETSEFNIGGTFFLMIPVGLVVLVVIMAFTIR